jgi:NAD-dependent SIR2 family protein deacetylase
METRLLRGRLFSATCLASGARGQLGGRETWRPDACPGRSKAFLRPDVAWYWEDQHLLLPRYLESLRRCPGFVSIGTAGPVTPAALVSSDARWAIHPVGYCLRLAKA